MNEHEIQLLAKLGINIIEITEPMANDNSNISTCGKFYIDESKFRPMCFLIKITDMIVESNNPAVIKMYDQLITMLHLTEEK